ncbi:MAG: hypothetical protein JSU66_12885 [Deltaproteobacteria bacterium]|nr:MAG: hypothetical protein JSU66_12885 [Deltaproteobacteria bacterium]
MPRCRYESFDPLFGADRADALIALCERFGRYGMYGQAPVEEELGRGLAQRHDAAMNFVRTGGRFARRESTATLAARTNYFRETYAYDKPVVPGIEDLMWHEGFIEAARRLYDRPVVRPAIVYANLLVPGQELTIHTDVPEFRGANRMRDPEWLCVVMHHSGLFERWRMPIATAVSWFGSCEGGEFAFYPDGADGNPLALPAKHNTAILLDTDSVFHGVDRVADTRAEFPPLRPGMQLVFDGGDAWHVESEGAVVARYRWSELRFSVSWKAHCFADEAERRAVDEHSDDLSRAQIVDTLVADLRARGRLGATRTDGTELALLMIDEYIRFPAAAPDAARAGD